MKADMRNKKFASNVHRENNFNILKTIGVYGPNNAGKILMSSMELFESSDVGWIDEINDKLE